MAVKKSDALTFVVGMYPKFYYRRRSTVNDVQQKLLCKMLLHL